MVQSALEALDRADAARAEIATVGMTSTTKTTGAVHVHPLCKLEREARQQFVTTWDRLHLGWDPQIDGMSLERCLSRMAASTADALADLEQDSDL
jgi:hypothetical protein